MQMPFEISGTLIAMLILQAPPAASPPAQEPAGTAETQLTLSYEASADGNLVHRTSFTPRPGSSPPGASGGAVWDARRVTFQAGGVQRVESASTIGCPNIRYVLERISSLDPGGFDVFGLSLRPLGLRANSRDGYTYRFEGPGLDGGGAPTRLSVQGSSGHIGELGRTADDQLRDCWRPE